MTQAYGPAPDKSYTAINITNYKYMCVCVRVRVRVCVRACVRACVRVGG